VAKDYAAQFIRELLKGRPLSDIDLIELSERDINEPYVYIRVKGGDDLRLACSVDDAPELLARVKGWRERPTTFPAPEPFPVAEYAVPLGWAAFAALILWTAWVGARDYWMVHGLSGVDHLPGGLIAALTVFTLFWLTVSLNPLKFRYYFMASPLILGMAFVFVSAGKALNAGLGAPREIAVCGRVIAVDDASFTAVFPRGRMRGNSEVPIPRRHISVQDERTGAIHRLEVPGWVAERMGLTVGMTWNDRYHEGAFGWRYRRVDGKGWDGQEFAPTATNEPCPR
jgi:hypothetical protein